MSKRLSELKGVGEKTEKLFEKLGIFNTEQLMNYYPRNYESFDRAIPISDVQEEKICTICAVITGNLYMNRTGRYQITTVTVSDHSGKITLMWFNMPYLRSTLKKGCQYYFRGKVSRKNGRLQMEHPQMYTPAAYDKIENTLQPIYGLTKGVTNNMITKLVRQVLDENTMYAEYLSDEIRQQFHLSDYNYALQTVHFPNSMDELIVARKRLVFDEFLMFILSVQQLKEKSECIHNSFEIKPDWITDEVIDSLPYKLTKAQTNVWYEIERDLTGHSLMSRLIQGDVGSGKTILAFLAMILTSQNGYQSALMAPTEVLAQQHYSSLLKLLKQTGIDNIEPILLTGSNTAKEKRIIYEKIESGAVQIIIGTHALIQEKVHYHNLALVITDEQHRFGVKQREALCGRENPPHVLVMSATPIPRTLAIILYGDLDISVIDELPASRLPIKNCVVGTSYRPTAYKFIEKEIRSGRQVYIICPMVEESEALDAENVIDYTKKMIDVFPSDISISYLHGKMKPKEKNQIMQDFASGKIQLLVSTTVIEVGVNVPNATVMMVENAERFGLAQLHQLRGRVGRGEHQSYCIFMQGNQVQETSKRLEILNKSNDGFYIASEDLKLRGPGDLFGIRQSGDLEFRIGDIYNDAAILKEASEAAAQILSLDPNLSLEQNYLLNLKMNSYKREDLNTLGI